jgi:hypothetical protein
MLAAAHIGLSDFVGLGGENDESGPAFLKSLVLPDPERFARFDDAQAFVKSESVLTPSSFFASL